MKKNLNKVFMNVFVMMFLLYGACVVIGNSITINASETSAIDVSVSNWNELNSALTSLTDDSQGTINLTGDITAISANIAIRGNIVINGNNHSIELSDFAGVGYYVDIKNGAKVTFNDLELTQKDTQNNSSAIRYRNNSKRGWVKFYDCSITTANPNALHSFDVDGLYYLHNTNVSAAGYVLYNGIAVVSGTSVLTGNVENNSYVYDFRQAKIAASPTPEEFSAEASVAFSIETQPQCYKGNDPVLILSAKQLYYTLDGSDPFDNGVLYTDGVSLAVDRKINVTMSYGGYMSLDYVTYEYNVNPDRSEGELDKVLSNLSMEIPSMGEVTHNFGETVAIKLKDGREMNAICDWDMSTVDNTVAGKYTVYGELTLPFFVSNASNIKASAVVTVYYPEISDFKLNQEQIIQQGKTSARPFTYIGYFSAKGGDNQQYKFSLVEDNVNGVDNNKFLLDNGILKISNTALKSGIYKLSIKVESAGKTVILNLDFEVVPIGGKITVSNNPYENIDWDATSHVKTATHNHTYFSNGDFEGSEHSDKAFGTVDERVECYKNLGYGAVIITEHDYVALDEGDFTDTSILTIPGNELSKNYHILSYNSRYYDSYGGGPSVSVGADKNIDNVRDLGGFIYFAHPARSTTDSNYWLNMFTSHLDSVYGMEVFNAGQPARNYSEKIWDDILTACMPARNIFGAASDDAHSVGSCGTGWTVCLLTDEQKTANGLANALKTGTTYFSTYVVDPIEDDNKDAPADPAPQIQSIDVSADGSKITMNATGYTTIQWVSANGKVVAETATIDLNDCTGVDKYVRCRMYGPGGMTHTQAIGVSESTELYDGNDYNPVDFPIEDPVNPTVTKISVSGAKTSFTVGESFSTGELKVTKSMTDGSTSVASSDEYVVNYDAYNSENTGEYVITVTLTGTSISTTYNVKVLNGSAPVEEEPASCGGCGSASFNMLYSFIGFGLLYFAIRKRY